MSQRNKETIHNLRAVLTSSSFSLGCVLCGEKDFVTDDFCVECRTRAETLKVPKPNDFYDNDGREVEYLLSAELAQIGRLLIRTYDEDFWHLQNAEVDYFWKSKGGSTGGRNTLGRCKKITGELKFYSEKDFLIWAAADNCFNFNYYQFVALVFHELKHTAKNPSNGKFEIVDHEATIFKREIELFGAWKNDLVDTAEAFKIARQPDLFG